MKSFKSFLSESNLQVFSVGKVLNILPVGTDLKRFCNDNIDLILSKEECGWMDGGCFTLATAFKLWLGSHVELEAVVRDKNDSLDHVVAKVAGVYLDGDGVASKEDVLEKMRVIESVMGSISIRPLKSKEEHELLPPNQSVASEMATKLEKRFGASEKFIARIKKELSQK